MLRLISTNGLTTLDFLKSERQWSRQSRLGRARFMLKDAWAREDRNDVAFFRYIIRVNDYDEEDKVWTCVRTV